MRVPFIPFAECEEPARSRFEERPMLYELRFYKVPPGRMDGHDERHRNHLPAIFARHGITCVGRWSAIAGPDLPIFAYLTIYPDFAERQRQWADFYGDDEWWRVRAATNGKTELVDQFDIHFLVPNPLWRPAGEPVPAVDGIHQLLFVEIGTGKIGDAAAFLRDVWIPKVVEMGGRLCWSPTSSAARSCRAWRLWWHGPTRVYWRRRRARWTSTGM
jgi:hypothetical protein